VFKNKVYKVLSSEEKEEKLDGIYAILSHKTCTVVR